MFRYKGAGANIVIYIDDPLVIFQSKKSIDAVAHLLKRQLKMRELDDVSFLLGCRIIRTLRAQLTCEMDGHARFPAYG